MTHRKTLSVFVAAVLLAGCSADAWTPWSKSPGPSGPYTPPGATAYACAGGKRLLVRYESDAKSAWVIYPEREIRLTRATSATGDQQFTNGRATLATRDGETTVEEGGRVEYGGCKPEREGK